jgi:polar amino acid transport system substrate-binding protein
MNKRGLLLLPSLLIVFCMVPAIGQSKFVVSTPGFDHPVAAIASKILPDAYKKLGLEMEFQDVPPARAVNMFDTNTADGYIFADASFTKDHPTAVMVNSPIGYDDIVVFTKLDNVVIKDWSSLKQYSIGYMIGMSVIENNIKGMKGDSSQNPSQAFQKLDGGRTDVVVMPKGVGLMVIKNLKLKGIKILEPPLEKVALYHFVTAKNASVAPRLASILDDLSKSGKLKSVTDQVESDFLK